MRTTCKLNSDNVESGRAKLYFTTLSSALLIYIIMWILYRDIVHSSNDPRSREVLF